MIKDTMRKRRRCKPIYDTATGKPIMGITLGKEEEQKRKGRRKWVRKREVKVLHAQLVCG